MQAHISQATHNIKFVCDCCESYPESYFDWKVTATFYTALHLLRALCEKRKVNPGRTHQDLANSLNPERPGKKATQIPIWVWKSYSMLQRYSEQARYDGFLNAEMENEVQKENYNHAQHTLDNLKLYFAKNGVRCDEAA